MINKIDSVNSNIKFQSIPRVKSNVKQESNPIVKPCELPGAGFVNALQAINGVKTAHTVSFGSGANGFTELEASIIILISINEPYIPFLRYFFKSNKIKIKESLFKELLSIIDIYKDDIPIWIYNGYSMREFSKLKQL